MKISRFLFALTVVLLTLAFVATGAQAQGDTPTTPTTAGFLAEFLNNLLLAFAPILAGALSAFLLAQARLLWAKLAAYRPDLADAMEYSAKIAVKAAEQAGLAELIDDKKEYALDVAQRYLVAKGFGAVDLELLSQMIEAAVLDEFNRWKDDAVDPDEMNLITDDGELG